MELNENIIQDYPFNNDMSYGSQETIVTESHQTVVTESYESVNNEPKLVNNLSNILTNDSQETSSNGVSEKTNPEVDNKEKKLENSENFFSNFEKREKIMDNENTNLIFLSEKSKLDNHIQTKITRLDVRLSYVNYKFEDLKYSFKIYSVLIIVFSTALTLIESFTNSIELDIDENLKKYLNFSPILLSCLISFLASLIKFNEYEEKIEEITRVTEKCIATVAKLKNIKEDIYFCKNEQYLESIKNKFQKNVYKEYLESNTSIEKQLIDSDYTKYMKKANKSFIKQKDLDKKKEYQLKLIDSKYINDNPLLHLEIT